MLWCKIKKDVILYRMEEITPTIHVPVLYEEVLQGLSPQPGNIYIDGTLGGGGHTIGLARCVGSEGCIIGIDRDANALKRTEERIKALPENLSVRYAQANYSAFPEVLELLHLEKVNGFLLDLGLSSDQLADRSRGFSFDSDGDLDLRFDTTEGQPAFELLNQWSAEKIADIIYHYGEERYSRRIARMIVEQRITAPLRSAADLANICRKCVPKVPPWSKQHIDPATRTFQALRIAVNEELDSLSLFLKRAPEFIVPGGKIAIISFHSLEDRIVKNVFRDTPDLTVITKKPIEAGNREREKNPRARSAKLRIAEKIRY